MAWMISLLTSFVKIKDLNGLDPKEVSKRAIFWKLNGGLIADFD